MPGPIPKRIAERRRRNIVPGQSVVEADGEVEVPHLPRGIHALARAWYESLRESGQSQFYEPSDWAAAVIAAKVLSVALRPSGTAAMMGQAWAMMEALHTTEAARRRARIEVERAMGETVPEGPTKIEEARKRLGLG